MQQNLFGQVENAEIVDDTSEDDDNLGSDIDVAQDVPLETTEYWNDFNAWETACKASKESYTYLRIDYNGNLAEQWINIHSGLERIWRGTSESYGGSWGSSNTQDMNELREEIIEFYEDQLDRPYNKALADEWAIRGIKRENIRVYYTEHARQHIIEKGGWDIKALITEMESKPEKLYDTTFELLMKEYNDTKEALGDIQKRMWDTDHKLQKYTSSYSDQDVGGDIIKSLYELRQKLKKDKAILEVKEQDLRKKFVRGYD